MINTTTPTGLQNAAFFVVGKMFCLCGGQEHRQLQLSQLKCLEDKYVYYENVSNNTNGSFKQLYVKNKVVPLYLSPEAGERCPVYLLDRYICKLSSETREKDLFYVRLLDKITSDPNRPWYSSVPPVFNPSLRTCVQRLKSAVTKLTTAYIQLLQQECSGVVSLKNLFRRGQVTTV